MNAYFFDDTVFINNIYLKIINFELKYKKEVEQKMITLKDFIIKTLKENHILITEKNIAKLRYKYTRKLKENNLWTTAKTIKIDRNETKLFKEDDLNNISQDIKPYLTRISIKEAGFDPKEIEKLKKKRAGELEDARLKMINSFVLDDKSTSKENPIEPKLTESQKQKALDRLMLTAIFNLFFTMSPRQKELFLHDYKNTFLDPDFTANDEWIISQERLKHPEKYYYNKKK